MLYARLFVAVQVRFVEADPIRFQLSAGNVVLLSSLGEALSYEITSWRVLPVQDSACCFYCALKLFLLCTSSGLVHNNLQVHCHAGFSSSGQALHCDIYSVATAAAAALQVGSSSRPCLPD